jgi:pimeloyl-ACP methyl ester carboxylesterase
MVASHTRGGGRITVDERADGSGDALQTVLSDVGDLAAEASLADFDLATLLTQVPAPLTALNLDACRARFHVQSAAVLIELEATVLAVRAAAFAYRQAEKGISEVFGGLLDALGWATGRALAISLPVLIPVALVVGGQVIAVTKFLDATGLDDVITKQFGIDLGKTKAMAKEALVEFVFVHSDFSGAVIEHVLPGIVVGFIGLPPGVLGSPAGHAYWPHDSQSMTMWALVAANQFGLLLPSDLEVWEAEGLTPPHDHPPRDLQDLYIREADCHRGSDSGQVRIEEIVGPDGQTRYIVYVPATTDWSAQSGDYTTDMTTNVQGMAGNETVMREMVRQAIADAGIGSEAEVMLVGYSQGGITAGSLAADPAFLHDVNVTALMTVGAPISDFPIDSGIDVLSIEHEQDLVPDLDGGENPAVDNWSTVTVDYDPEELRKTPELANKTDAELDEMFASAGAAHSSTAYAASIGLLLRAGTPALTRFTAENSGFFTGDLKKTRDYQGKRKHT